MLVSIWTLFFSNESSLKKKKNKTKLYCKPLCNYVGILNNYIEQNNLAIKKKIGNNRRLNKSIYHSHIENHRRIQRVLSINRHAFHAKFLIPHPKQKYIEQKIE